MLPEQDLDLVIEKGAGATEVFVGEHFHAPAEVVQGHALGSWRWTINASGALEDLQLTAFIAKSALDKMTFPGSAQVDASKAQFFIRQNPGAAWKPLEHLETTGERYRLAPAADTLLLGEIALGMPVDDG
jgi:hypothetical protein